MKLKRYAEVISKYNNFRYSSMLENRKAAHARFSKKRDVQAFLGRETKQRSKIMLGACPHAEWKNNFKQNQRKWFSSIREQGVPLSFTQD